MKRRLLSPISWIFGLPQAVRWVLLQLQKVNDCLRQLGLQPVYWVLDIFVERYFLAYPPLRVEGLADY